MNFLVVATNQIPLRGSAANQDDLTGLTGQTMATIVRDTLRRVYKKSEIKLTGSEFRPGPMARPLPDSGSGSGNENIAMERAT